jgi:predicted nucleic acid-binding protein
MNDKVFLDTNILIYLYSKDEPSKQLIAKQIFSNHTNVIVSTQILS